MLTEVDGVDSKDPKTLRASFLAVLAGAVHRILRVTFDETELRREKDLVAFSRASEPFSKELFIVSVHASVPCLEDELD